MRKQCTRIFIPSKDNNFKPDFLERTSMGIMLVLVMLTFAVANIQSLIWIDSSRMVSTVLPAVIVDLTNEERSGGSLTTLRRNTLLDHAAQMKAEDMVEKEYFAHYSPEGLSPWHWLIKAGYAYHEAGENLAVHFTDSKDVVEAWMGSPGHRANIVNKNYTEIGVGSARGEYNGVPTVYVVQLFGTPSSPQTAQLTIEVIPVRDVAVDATSTLALMQKSQMTENVLGEEITTDAPVIQSREESTIVQEVPPPITVAPSNAVMYSDLATTSQPGVSTVSEETTSQPSGLGESPIVLSTVEKSIMRPSSWLHVLYIALALVVTIALVLSIVIEWRRQNPIQIVYATGLLVLMAVLFYTHTVLTGGVTII